MSRFKRKWQAGGNSDVQQTRKYIAADYMDESFLAIEAAAPPPRRSKPKDAVVLSKKEVHAAMLDKREEGLTTALGADNRGFNLLAKMGYKGGGLGKDGSGAVAPIKPVIKTCRSGIGKEAEKRRSDDLKQTLLQRMRAARANGAEQRQKDFRAVKSRQFRDKRAAGDLSRVRRLIETFDTGAGIVGSAMWPGEPEDTILTEEEHITAGYDSGSGGSGGGGDSGGGSGGGSSGGGNSSSGGLAVTLAASSSRCWHEEKEPYDQGIAAAHDPVAGYDPGGERGGAAAVGQEQDEGSGAAAVTAAAAAAEAAERQEWAALDPSEQLSCCLGYLRNKYLHCAFCGITFDGAEDMAESCPGPSREDHDDDA